MKRVNKKYVNGSATIEMSIIIPLILAIFMLIVFTIFFFHDKNIITASLMEVCVVGANKYHEDEEFGRLEIEEAIRERIGRKCILLQYNIDSVEISKEKMEIEVIAQKGRFKTRIWQSMSLTKPEKEIREEKKWKSVLQ